MLFVVPKFHFTFYTTSLIGVLLLHLKPINALAILKETYLTHYFSNIKRVVQDQTAQGPWMLREEIGLQLHGRFSQIAQVFATEQDQASCDSIMNLVGSYDGVKRTYNINHFLTIIRKLLWFYNFYL